MRGRRNTAPCDIRALGRAILVALALTSCSKAPAGPSPPAALVPRVITVVVIATPVPENSVSVPAETLPPQAFQAFQTFQTAEQTFRLPAPGSGANDPGAPSVGNLPRQTIYDEMVRCLTFTLEKDGAVAVSTGVQLKVSARNHCPTSFAAGDLLVEVRARPWNGTGVAAREIIRFQGDVGPNDSALTYVVLHIDPDRSFRFEASPWPSAGSARPVGE